jgi:hypothetical protein
VNCEPINKTTTPGIKRKQILWTLEITDILQKISLNWLRHRSGGPVGTPDEPFVILQITRRTNIEEGNESQGNTSPYRKLYQQFGAVCGNDESFLRKNKSATVTVRSSQVWNHESEPNCSVMMDSAYFWNNKKVQNSQRWLHDNSWLKLTDGFLHEDPQSASTDTKSKLFTADAQDKSIPFFSLWFVKLWKEIHCVDNYMCYDEIQWWEILECQIWNSLQQEAKINNYCALVRLQALRKNKKTWSLSTILWVLVGMVLLF